MKFSAALAFTDPDQYLPLAKACDEAGIWAVACSDHVVHPRQISSPYPYTTDGSPRFKPVSYTHLTLADDLLCVDLGGRRIIKKKKNITAKYAAYHEISTHMYTQTPSTHVYAKDADDD